MAAVPCLRRRPSSRLYPTECIKMFHLIVILPSLSVSLLIKPPPPKYSFQPAFNPFPANLHQFFIPILQQCNRILLQ